MNFLYSLFLFFGIIPFLIKNFSLQRLGFCLPKIKPDIWIHCASVGEIAGIKPFIDELRKTRSLSIIVSTITKTGDQVARGFGEIAIYLPIDFSFIIRSVLKRLSPKILIIQERELWPNLIREAKRQGIKIALINGRISEKSKKRYLAVSSLMKGVISCFDLFLMQTEDDKNRIKELGPENDKIFITGNTKFDWLYKDIPDIKLKFEDKNIIVFGSIREREEEIILKCAKRLVLEKKVSVVIAPRHIDRASIILKNKGFIRRSSASYVPSCSIVILDTIGELRSFYKKAKITFVGGSLFPYGCHNLIEPAILGKPVLFGRYPDNFKDCANSLKKDKGGFEISDEASLFSQISYLLENPDQLKKMGKNAKDVALNLIGASKRCIPFILNLLH
ncbi:MAG: glycosyltransferase N-terminal domain-containing protein [bacterium]